jgi:hypothetical protein
VVLATAPLNNPSGVPPTWSERFAIGPVPAGGALRFFKTNVTAEMCPSSNGLAHSYGSGIVGDASGSPCWLYGQQLHSDVQVKDSSVISVEVKDTVVTVGARVERREHLDAPNPHPNLNSVAAASKPLLANDASSITRADIGLPLQPIKTFVGVQGVVIMQSLLQ